MNLIFFENRALSIHGMLLFGALDAYTSVYEHQVVRSTSASINVGERERTKEHPVLYCSVSSIILAKRHASLWIFSFIYSPGRISCSLFNAVDSSAHKSTPAAG